MNSKGQTTEHFLAQPQKLVLQSESTSVALSQNLTPSNEKTIEIYFQKQNQTNSETESNTKELNEEEKQDFNEYSNFFSSISSQIEKFTLQQISKETLEHHRIKVFYGNDFQKDYVIKYGSDYIYIRQTRHYGTECTYDVIIGKFYLTIRMLNLHRNSTSSEEENIGAGSFGIVKEVLLKNGKIAIKKIKFTHKPETFFLANFTDIKDQSTCSEIFDVIREYCLYKICSMLEIGPKVIFADTYDLVCYNDCIEFQMELCEDIKNIESKTFEEDLKFRLWKLHSLNFIHKDIKPNNIVYSPSLKGYVFTDFGLAHSIQQSKWEKTLTKAQGSLDYGSQAMKNLLRNRKSGTINLYINDIASLRKTLLQIEEIYEPDFYTSPFSQNYSDDYQTYKSQGEESFSNFEKEKEFKSNLSSQLSTKQSNDDCFNKYSCSINFYQMACIFRILNQESNKNLTLERLKQIVDEQCLDEPDLVKNKVVDLSSQIFFSLFQDSQQFLTLSFQNKVRIYGMYSEEVSDFLQEILAKNTMKGIDMKKIKQLIQKIQKTKPKTQIQKIQYFRKEFLRHKNLKNQLCFLYTLKKYLKIYINDAELSQKENLREKIFNLYLQVKGCFNFSRRDMLNVEKKMRQIMKHRIKNTDESQQVQLIDAINEEIKEKKWFTYHNIWALIKNYIKFVRKQKAKILYEYVKNNIENGKQNHFTEIMNSNYIQFQYHFLTQNYIEAEILVRKNLQIENQKGSKYTEKKFICSDFLVKILINQGKLNEAQQKNEQSLELKKQFLFPRKWGLEFSHYYKNAGHIQFLRQNYHKSAELIEKCLNNIKRGYEDQYLDYDMDFFYAAKVSLAACYQKTENFSKAIEILEESTECFSEFFYSEPEKLIYIVQNMIKLKLRHERFVKSKLAQHFKNLISLKKQLIDSKRLLINHPYGIDPFQIQEINQIPLKEQIVLKRIIINSIEPYLPYFRTTYLIKCFNIIPYYHKEDFQISLIYQQKFLRNVAIVKRDEDFYKKLLSFIESLMKLNKKHSANNFINKFIYLIPEKYSLIRKKFYEKKSLIEQFSKSDRFYTLLLNQKAYASKQCYLKCEKEFKKINCPLKRAIWLKKLKRIKPDSLFEKNCIPKQVNSLEQKAERNLNYILEVIQKKGKRI